MQITQEDGKLIIQLSKEKTNPEIVRYFNGKYKYDQIFGYLRQRKLKAQPIDPITFSAIQAHNARHYTLNEDYFKTWSREMAYIFGLWCADGCMHRNKIFDITLASEDKYMLENIAKEMRYTGKVIGYTNRDANRLEICSTEVYQDLLNLGGTERKSLTLKFPEVPNEYMADYIRGYFDGDGCISVGERGRTISAITCGSEQFILTLWEILKEQAHMQGGYYDKSRYTIQFGKKDSIKLGAFLYKDEPKLYLSRKRDKFNLIGGK